VTRKITAVPVVCAIIEHRGRFLAAKRAQGQSNALLWEFPGGKVKDGEAVEDALRRELLEELGVIIKVVSPLTHVFHTYPWISIDLIPFICSIASGSPGPHEHAEIRWVDKEEALKLDWAPADMPVLDEYLARFS
jgi:8-oxo-dGTP diphosphatase